MSQLVRAAAGRILLAAIVAVLATCVVVADVPRTEPQADCHAADKEIAKKGYEHDSSAYTIPEVVLLDQDGRKVPLPKLMSQDQAIVLDFIFTSCRTICPVLSSTMANLRRALGPEYDNVTMISVSIDPEFDSPPVLKGYASRFGATPNWLFLTGSVEDIISVQRAFEAYPGDKSAHRPLTFLKPRGANQWVRLEGFPKAAEIAEEWRTASAAR